MNRWKSVGLAITFALSIAVAGVSAVPAEAAGAAGRQYYSKYWQPKGGYYYRLYHYRPAPRTPYRYHVVVHYPARPRYYYYYNPGNRKYWGRFDRVDGTYARLPAADQRGMLTEIETFPEGGEFPPIPDSTDDTRMDSPPFGLPPIEPELLTGDDFKSIVLPKEEKMLPRQVYTDWCKQNGYYFRSYCCQPKAGGSYTTHRVIYYPSKPRYVYYYNPAKKKYWGRYDMEAKGYSLLADKDRAERIAAIAEDAFPKPGAMPPIPGADDGVRMVRPPVDLPVNDKSADGARLGPPVDIIGLDHSLRLTDSPRGRTAPQF